MYKQIIECRSQKCTRIKTNLEILLNSVKKQTGIKTENIEVSTPFLVPPWWTPPLITVASTKEQAINQHKTTVQNSMGEGLVPIFTDGSGINGKIGASAVTASISDQAYLGPDTQYTVFAGELYGILLALHIAYFIIQIEKRTNTKTPIIYTDNQAALTRMSTPNSGGPGQSIMGKIVSQIDCLKHQQILLNSTGSQRTKTLKETKPQTEQPN